MASNKKKPPQYVEWAQDRILSSLRRYLSDFSQFTFGKTVSTDDKAVAVNDVRNSEILSALHENTEVLNRIADHLSVLSGIKLERGESL